jgi:hypothetical protein
MFTSLGLGASSRPETTTGTDPSCVRVPSEDQREVSWSDRVLANPGVHRYTRSNSSIDRSRRAKLGD